uniref:Uncharacterized protein n=1 Tax=Acrobeloides nanus TaxID=290746 RepID=A0A914DXE5_9BILA
MPSLIWDEAQANPNSEQGRAILRARPSRVLGAMAGRAVLGAMAEVRNGLATTNSDKRAPVGARTLFI